jgi:hypothetical protein
MRFQYFWQLCTVSCFYFYLCFFFLIHAHLGRNNTFSLLKTLLVHFTLDIQNWLIYIDINRSCLFLNCHLAVFLFYGRRCFMKKAILINSLILAFFISASPVFAQSADVSKIENFIKSITQILVTVAGVTATAFFVWGGLRYITSSGSPEQLDSAKKTIVYSAVGLAIALGALVLSNIVTQIATNAFGA